MNSSPPLIIKHIGLDVHARSILPAIASDDGEVRPYGKIGGKLADVDRFIKRLEQPGIELRFVYEAGPTGYGLARHLRQQNYLCEVAAPSGRAEPEKKPTLVVIETSPLSRATPLHSVALRAATSNEETKT
jgi:hypothetical protein